MPKKSIDLSSYTKCNATHQHSKYSAFIQLEHTQEYCGPSKAKSINMAFSERNYSFIMAETSRLAINCAYFLNHIISSINTEELKSYADSQPLRKGNHAPRKKGCPMKRIYIKFSAQNYKILSDCSALLNITITTAVNMIIEIYAQNNFNTPQKQQPQYL